VVSDSRLNKETKVENVKSYMIVGVIFIISAVYAWTMTVGYVSANIISYFEIINWHYKYTVYIVIGAFILATLIPMKFLDSDCKPKWLITLIVLSFIELISSVLFTGYELIVLFGDIFFSKALVPLTSFIDRNGIVHLANAIAGIALISISICAYYIRCRWRFSYGAIEIILGFFGFIWGVHSIDIFSHDIIDKSDHLSLLITQMIGGLFFMVRGLNNIHEYLLKSDERYDNITVKFVRNLMYIFEL